MKSLAEIRSALSAHEPETLPAPPTAHAAVAVILREVDGVPEVLFIERAKRAGDPWSGHMAFPGGRLDPADEGARNAAERETLEEVGVSLACAEALGRLDDLQGHPAAARSGAAVISAFVYHVAESGPLKPNREVEQAFWFPLPSLFDPERRVEYPVSWGGLRYPGILVGEPERHVVWGLTYRFLEVFFEIIGRPLPNRSEVPA